MRTRFKLPKINLDPFGSGSATLVLYVNVCTLYTGQLLKITLGLCCSPAGYQHGSVCLTCSLEHYCNPVILTVLLPIAGIIYYVSLMSLQAQYSMLLSNKECIDLRGDLVQYAFMHSAGLTWISAPLCVWNLSLSSPMQPSGGGLWL